jgi:signal transduction histidine kinase
MADRLAAVGGTLRIDSVPGAGTTISGALPVSEPARAPASVRASPGP